MVTLQFHFEEIIVQLKKLLQTFQQKLYSSQTFQVFSINEFEIQEFVFKFK